MKTKHITEQPQHIQLKNTVAPLISAVNSMMPANRREKTTKSGATTAAKAVIVEPRYFLIILPLSEPNILLHKQFAKSRRACCNGSTPFLY
jgi:hypothetical protein